MPSILLWYLTMLPLRWIFSLEKNNMLHIARSGNNRECCICIILVFYKELQLKKFWEVVLIAVWMYRHHIIIYAAQLWSYLHLNFRFENFKWKQFNDSVLIPFHYTTYSKRILNPYCIDIYSCQFFFRFYSFTLLNEYCVTRKCNGSKLCLQYLNCTVIIIRRGINESNW